MEVFNFRENIVENYKRYVSSFLNINDDEIKAFVDTQIKNGHFWPEPLIQINLNYKNGASITELVNQGKLHRDMQKIFKGRDGAFNLRVHQNEALELANREKSFVVTTGTGSGKSLTYIIPIINDILTNPDRPGVRAILVYPMNALINSQQEEIAKFLKNAPELKGKIKFARYTGQESKEEKEKNLQDVPHIILTNYVMLELMLTRREEKRFFEQSSIKYLVLDELHTYRGRQGADVSILVRRLKERINNANLLCIGTSATMSSEGGMGDRKRAVSQTATKLFGTMIIEDQVIEETLERVTHNDFGLDYTKLSTSLNDDTSKIKNDAEFKMHPLASWIELNVAIEDANGVFMRRSPQTIEEIAKKLSTDANIAHEIARTKLTQALEMAASLKVFAFRLHQFISQGGMVYSTIEEKKQYSLDGQVFTKDEKLLYPIVFCRDCGQSYHIAHYEKDNNKLLPFVAERLGEDEISDKHYFALDENSTLWNGFIEELPDNWLRETRKGTTVKDDFAPFIPQTLYVDSAGNTSPIENEGNQRVALLQAPFCLCLNCGRNYQRNQKSDFSKLSRLSSEGRSTATTLLSMSVVGELIQTNEEKETCKIMSFTDNRQDASLQAGHFNDFVVTVILRTAIYAALKDKKELIFSTISQEVFKKLDLPQGDYAREAGTGLKEKRNKETFLRYIEYRIYQELKRGWKFVQPNLEQTGLLKIEYDSLNEFCHKNSKETWKDCPTLLAASPEVRIVILNTVLDYLRKSFAIDAPILKDPKKLKSECDQALNTRWGFDTNEYPEEQGFSAFSKVDDQNYVSINSRSSLGKFLKSPKAWSNPDFQVNENEYQELIIGIMTTLKDNGYVISEHDRYYLDINCIKWIVADENHIILDVVRTKRVGESLDFKVPVNLFFKKLYQGDAQLLRRMIAAEHTGQVSTENRIKREADFRAGDLTCLYCSPTMELGIDISSLNVVHMRNVPPNPANYAQRSGRAGRGGQGAFVATYASHGSPHDQYYFKHQKEMVSGAVVAPKLDLKSIHLLRTHIHSVWLSYIGLDLSRNIAELFDLNRYPELPIAEDKKLQLELSEDRIEKCVASCKKVFSGSEFAVTDDFIKEEVLNSKNAFHLALDFWRREYKRATEQREKSNNDIERSNRGDRSVDREESEQSRREAERKIKLLIGESNGQRDWSSDFYPYRYLATQGFLPGYNFPNSPVKAVVSSGGDIEYVTRPRFVAIKEYAPNNVIYHEGSQYRIKKMDIGAGEFQSLEKRVKTCKDCGYLLEGEQHNADVCPNCKSTFDAENSNIIPHLLEMLTVSTKRVQKITCEEEERLRSGYSVSTNYRFVNPPVDAEVKDAKGKSVLALKYAPATEIWRINHGLKIRRGQGFLIDKDSGQWISENDANPAVNQETVKLFVKDQQNTLIIKLDEESFDSTTGKTLMYALARSIEIHHQLEENEISCELINNQILFWESSEGGIGVLEYLINSSTALAHIAEVALDLCHFKEESDLCSKACYQCLLSYSNQQEHLVLDRFLIEDVLRTLSTSVVEKNSHGLSRTEHFEKLLALTDPRSELERHYLNFLNNEGLVLPDYAQKSLTDFNAQPDFYYEAKKICVFCNGSAHDSSEQRERDSAIYEDLKDLGYRVEVIRYDDDWKGKVVAKIGDIY
jgi:ATP-dependent helicase YprA (DUF1998 family)